MKITEGMPSPIKYHSPEITKADETTEGLKEGYRASMIEEEPPIIIKG